MRDEITPVYSGYCVTCKAKQEFHGEVGYLSSGRKIAIGVCPVCNSKLTRIL